MPFPYVLAIFAAVLLAGAVVAVVAIASGKLQTNLPRLQQFAERTEEVLEGQGDMPRFLERLDDIGDQDSRPRVG